MSFDAKVIRSSFSKAKPAALEIVSRFYGHLWADYPDSKELFKSVDPDAQKKVLARALSYIVDNLESPETLAKYLHSMGARHVRYGVHEEHYGWVKAALLKTFAEAFGRLWTTDLHRNWDEALTAVAQLMLEGAKSPPDEAPAQAAEVIPLHGSEDRISIELPAEVKKQIRTAIRQALHDAIQQEMQSVIAEELNALSSGGIRDLLRRHG
jgi:hemoglobin-like flavoprotein